MLRDGIITVYGEEAWRPYLHVEDAVNMIILILEKKLSGVYNLGTDELNYTKRQIIEEIQKSYEFLIKPIVWDDPRDYKVNFSKINEKIDYTIKYKLNDGVNELLNHMTTNDFKIKQNIKNNRHV